MRRAYGAVAKTLRETRGMTQLGVCLATGVNPKAISALENGRRLPEVRTLAKIARCYGVSIEELLGISDGCTDDGTTAA